MLAFVVLISCSSGEQVETNQASLFGHFSRKEDALPVDEFMTWIENKDNGLKVEKNIGDLNFSALYKPYEYLAVMELKKGGLNKQVLKKKMQEYEGMYYFTFKITSMDQHQELLKKGIDTEQEYYSRLEYFSFGMQNDFKLIDGKDTLNCTLYHFERVYGLAPCATMVLGFTPAGKHPVGKLNNNVTLGYEDKLFGAGNVYMTFKEEDLKRIPAVKLD